MKKIFLALICLCSLYACKHEEEPTAKELAEDFYTNHYNFDVTIYPDLDEGDSMLVSELRVGDPACYTFVAPEEGAHATCYEQDAKDLFSKSMFVDKLTDWLESSFYRIEDVEEVIYFTCVIKKQNGSKKLYEEKLTKDRNIVILH